MQALKNRSRRRTACLAFFASCGACNALLDNHSRELRAVPKHGAGGEATVSAGAAGDPSGEAGRGEGGASGASAGGNELPDGGAAGTENEPPEGGRAGSPTGGTSSMGQSGASQGGMPACTGCKPGLTEPQSRSCGICNGGKQSGTRTCTPSCTWKDSWDACKDDGTAENGCSLVKWCDNEDNRTECALIGCTAAEAEAECRKEAAAVCGTVKNLLITTQCP
jgi:hypothetical protein